MSIRVEKVVTSGTFALDGGEWDVENNIWLIGDDSEVVIVDAAHSAAPIIDAVGGRVVKAIVCTHGHNDHVTVAPELSRELDAPVLLHPADDMLWEQAHTARSRTDSVFRLPGRTSWQCTHPGILRGRRASTSRR